MYFHMFPPHPPFFFLLYKHFILFSFLWFFMSNTMFHVFALHHRSLAVWKHTAASWGPDYGWKEGTKGLRLKFSYKILAYFSLHLISSRWTNLKKKNNVPLVPPVKDSSLNVMWQWRLASSREDLDSERRISSCQIMIYEVQEDPVEWLLILPRYFILFHFFVSRNNLKQRTAFLTKRHIFHTISTSRKSLTLQKPLSYQCCGHVFDWFIFYFDTALLYGTQSCIMLQLNHPFKAELRARARQSMARIVVVRYFKEVLDYFKGF